MKEVGLKNIMMILVGINIWFWDGVAIILVLPHLTHF
jgi:hypothetical protein